MIRNLLLIGLLGFSTTTFAIDDLDLDNDTDFPSETDQLDDIDELPEVAKKKAKKSPLLHTRVSLSDLKF